MIAYHQVVTPETLPGSELDRLLAGGWYRMHQTIFSTTHLIGEEIYRVHWLRYLLGEIRSHASHRRIRNRNRDFRYTIEKFNAIRQDHEELYVRYRESIDFNGAFNIQHCLYGDEGLDKGIYTTYCISVFDQDQLIAGGYFDVGSMAGTSILHFYDPRYKDYSLGKYLMLLTADFLYAGGYVFYYPGYVVAGLPKMDYKLFMGKEATQYFDAGTATWKNFEEGILTREKLTAMEQLELLLAFSG